MSSEYLHACVKIPVQPIVGPKCVKEQAFLVPLCQGSREDVRRCRIGPNVRMMWMMMECGMICHAASMAAMFRKGITVLIFVDRFDDKWAI